MNRLKAYLARQLGHPSGWVGRLILRLLNRENAMMNMISFKALDVQTRQNILEIGFGGGSLIDHLLKTEKSLKVTAIDMSDTAVAMARNRFKEAITSNRLVVHQANAEAMPFIDNTFDAIVTVNTLYFWSDISAVLNECQRCLKPGGRLVVTYASKEFLETQQATQFGFQAYEVSEVEAFLNTVGFDVIETISSEDMSNGSFFCTSGTVTYA